MFMMERVRFSNQTHHLQQVEQFMLEQLLRLQVQVLHSVKMLLVVRLVQFVEMLLLMLIMEKL